MITLSSLQILLLIIIFLITSMISVVTGSNSLITVPAMIKMGIEARTALATNMMGLTFMSLGASLPFLKQKTINFHRLRPLVILTVISSALGAGLLFVVPSPYLPQLVSVCMVGVVIFSLLNREAGILADRQPSPGQTLLGYGVTFLLGIYGGFFSGGYVTLLTACFVGFFQMTYLEAIASTKMINVFSSLIATSIFMFQGVIDYPLGILLGITMFMGGMMGSKIALKIDNLWLRRIFRVTVIALAVMMLKR